MQRNLPDARLVVLVEAGVAREALITRVRQSDGHKWAILVKYGMQEQVFRSRREPIHLFNTIDMAVKQLIDQMTLDYS